MPSYPDFSTLAVAYAGPEGPAGQPNPAPRPAGQMSVIQKIPIDNASFILAETAVCQVPNKATTLGLFDQAQSAILVFEGATSDVNVSWPIARMWLDGTAPTTITGIPLYAGQPYELKGQFELTNARIVSADGAQHAVQVQFFSGL
jgi:hypothetical protein